MTTSVNLTPEEMAEIQELTNQSDPSTAVRAAMAEFLRFARRQRLKAMSGHVQMEDNWRELEAAELKSQDASPGTGAH